MGIRNVGTAECLSLTEISNCFQQTLYTQNDGTVHIMYNTICISSYRNSRLNRDKCLLHMLLKLGRYYKKKNMVYLTGAYRNHFRPIMEAES